MYKITDHDFHSSEYGQERYLSDWPMLYILENGQEAYIGESTNIIMRMSQHKANEAKERFKTAHFIYSNEFNQSVTFDYESKLIQMIAADQQFIITNANSGLADKNYFEKAKYDEKIDVLWERLRKKKLAIHTIDEIINSDLFKYSPFKELNDDQRKAVDEIFQMILSDPNQGVIVSGMPGSGKTIVAIYLMKLLRDYTDENTGIKPFANKKIGLVIPPTSLRKTLKELFRHIYGLKAADVIGPSEVVKQHYDILLIDEAHRLHQRKAITAFRAHDENNRKLGLGKDGTELDWVLKQSECPILFYDALQVVGPWGINAELLHNKINARFKDRVCRYYELLTQMRVKGGNDYIAYIKSLLSGSIAQKESFSEYEFKLVDQFNVFENLMYQKEAENGLSRMIAGFAWKWISKKDKTKKDITIERISRMWNCKTENWVTCETAIDEVGCIHSIQGYDLNYAFVILGPDIYYDKTTGEIKANAKNYFDSKGKQTKTEEELRQYITNIYYVLLTRGILGTYIYVCDPALKEYCKKYIDVL